MLKDTETFEVEVENEGHFVFRRRNLRIGFAIMAEQARILGPAPRDDIEEGDPEDILGQLVSVYSMLKHQIVEAPDGWDIDAMDPQDNASYRRMTAVWVQMRQKEEEMKGRKAAVATDA